MNAKSELRWTVRGLAALIAISIAAPALAKDICSVPKAQWQLQSTLVKKLEAPGWKIRNIA